MSAGLPGFGLGGIFFIVSALIAPFGELARTARGHSSRTRWAGVARQFVMALAMVVAIFLGLGMAGLVTGSGPLAAIGSFSLLPVAATSTLLALVLLGAKGAQLVLDARARRRERRRHARRLRPLESTDSA
jgi:hypothetical protein